jgi:hypothetical protein
MHDSSGGAFVRFLFITVAALCLAGCAEHPERACALPAARATAVDVIFDKVNRSIEGTQWDGLTPDLLADLKRQVTALHQEKFISLDHVVLNKFDKTTKLATCGAEVHFHLTAADKGRATAGFHGLNITGMTPPEDLYGTDPLDNIEFGSQPTPDGKDTIVTEGEIPTTISAVLTIALMRVMSHQ